MVQEVTRTDCLCVCEASKRPQAFAKPQNVSRERRTPLGQPRVAIPATVVTVGPASVNSVNSHGDGAPRALGVAILEAFVAFGDCSSCHVSRVSTVSGMGPLGGRDPRNCGRF